MNTWLLISFWDALLHSSNPMASKLSKTCVVYWCCSLSLWQDFIPNVKNLRIEKVPPLPHVRLYWNISWILYFIFVLSLWMWRSLMNLCMQLLALPYNALTRPAHAPKAAWGPSAILPRWCHCQNLNLSLSARTVGNFKSASFYLR